jgi:hypothetical protein
MISLNMMNGVVVTDARVQRPAEADLGWFFSCRVGSSTMCKMSVRTVESMDGAAR